MSLSAIPTSPIIELDIDAEKLVVDKKREQDSNHKWARGIRDGPGSAPRGQFVNPLDHKWEVSARDQELRNVMKEHMKIRPEVP